MNTNAVGKGLLILAFVGAVGLGVGVGVLLRDSRIAGVATNGERRFAVVPADVSKVERRETQSVDPPSAQAPVTYPVKIPDTATSVAHATQPETSIIERVLANEERMLANEKRLGDALFMFRRDLKNFQDSIALTLARQAAAPPQNGYARADRYEKSIAVRRAVEGLLK